MLNKHLARGFQLSFLQDIGKVALCTRKVLEKHPQPELLVWTTNQTFQSMRQGYSAGDRQSTEEVKKKHKTTFPPTTCVSWVPLSSHSPCASAIGLPDSLHTSISGTSGCRTCAEQTHPAIQEANSWCSQHINIVVVEMLRIQQLSKNYYIIFLASLILFF